MRRGLLVARVDHAQIVLEAGLEDRVEMATVQSEDFVYAFALERSGQHLPAVYAWHKLSPRIEAWLS